jgi:hypothetical protein
MMKNILLFFLFSINYLVVFAQSPWAPKVGKGYAHIAYNFIPTYDAVSINGVYQKLGYPISESTIQGYLELGLGKGFSIQTSVPFVMQSGNETGASLPNSITKSGSLNGIGNIEIGLKKTLIDRGFTLSVFVNALLPAAKAKGETGLVTGYATSAIIPYLSIGSGTEKLYGYLYSGTGIFGDNFSGDFRVGGEVGYKLFKPLWIAFNGSMRKSLNNGSFKPNIYQKSTSLFVNNQEYDSYFLKAMYQSKGGFGINYGMNLFSTFSRNLPNQRPYSFSFSYKFQ